MRLLMHHQFHLGGAMLELRKQFVDVPPADKLAAMARLLQELELSFFKTDDDAGRPCFSHWPCFLPTPLLCQERVSKCLSL
jgi:hypothetical protein